MLCLLKPNSQKLSARYLDIAPTTTMGVAMGKHMGHGHQNI